MKAYSYLRFSTKDQLKGDSQRRQTEAAAAWCKANGVELAQEYSDLGVSAYRGSNRETGALSQFLKAVESGKVPRGSILLVESFDRISRQNIQIALRLFMEIMEKGVDVVTLTDGRRYNSAKLDLTDLIIFLSVASRANEESAMKSSRIKSVWAARRIAAASTKQPLPGLTPAWVRRTGAKLELIPDRAKIVRRIFDLAAAGMASRGIVRKLNSEKVPCFNRGGTWQASSVRKMLRSRSAIGEHTPKDSTGTPYDTIKGYFPAVVDAKTFATVNARLSAQARPGARQRVSGNVFAGLIVDKVTGSSIVRTSKTKTRHYLMSADYMNGVPGVKRAAWNYADFLESFLTLTHKASLAKASAPDRRTADLDVTRLELTDTEKQADRLADFLAHGNASAAVSKRLTALEAQRQELKAKIVSLENAQHAEPTHVNEVDWTDTEALRENLRATVKRITIDAGNRSFVAEFLDGRVYEYREHDGKVTISTPEELK